MKKLALTIMVLGLWAIKAVHAAEFFCYSGDVSCLIAKINKANQTSEEDTINLAAGTYTLTSVDNTSGANRNGLPRITSPITINGEGAENTIIERDPGAPGFRIFDVDTSGRLALSGLTVTGGSAGRGAGINNNGTLTITDTIIAGNGFTGVFNGGALTVLRSIIRGNFGAAPDGTGGILNAGTATIISSSITFNHAQAGAGGIMNGLLVVGRVGSMTIHNSTISDNTGEPTSGIWNRGGRNFENLFQLGVMIITNSTIANNGTVDFLASLPLVGGIFNEGVLHIANSTISGNRGIFLPFVSRNLPSNIENFEILTLQNTIVEECTARGTPIPLTSLGNNIIGDPNNCDINLLSSDLTGDPGLGAYVDDGMPGRGHFPLSPGSQAIDAGNSDLCTPTDQLGFPRVGRCDIGAVEFQGQLLVTIDVRPRSDANRINPNSTNNINVAILSGNGFDARDVDPNTIRFGASGTEAAPIHVGRRDVDEDGDRDVVVRFQIQDTGIKCGDTSATLTGQISGGPSIIGSSPIQTVQC